MTTAPLISSAGALYSRSEAPSGACRNIVDAKHRRYGGTVRNEVKDACPLGDRPKAEGDKGFIRLPELKKATASAIAF